MKLGYTIFYVQDVRSAVAFYGSAFGFAPRFVHESGDWAELDTGSTALSFCSHSLLAQMGKKPQAPNLHSPCFEIALVCEDVAAAMRRAVLAGAHLVHEPEQMPWGQTIAYVADPEGFLIEICTPMAPVASPA